MTVLFILLSGNCFLCLNHQGPPGQTGTEGSPGQKGDQVSDFSTITAYGQSQLIRNPSCAQSLNSLFIRL